uniref:DUF5641 domain-containing protein n=1 Tax=Strigamia maritima TaxID=126957 RepID=T1IYK4_STRMM
MLSFWNRWSREYLAELKMQQGKAGNTELKVDDVVLIEEQCKPRLHWKMGRVDNVHIGRDGKVRSCELVTAEGGRLRRPIQRLIHLEVQRFSGPAGVRDFVDLILVTNYLKIKLLYYHIILRYTCTVGGAMQT